MMSDTFSERSEAKGASFLRKALLESGDESPTLVYEPGITTLAPGGGQPHLNSSQLLGQAWALVGTLVCMWIAVILLALSQEGGWQLLAVAGGAAGSGIILVLIVEWQRRRFDELVPMHDWMLGTSIVMAFLALMWGIRAVWGLLSNDWTEGLSMSPDLRMIPAQSGTAILFVLLTARWLKSIGAGTTAWFTLAMTPYALAAVGCWRWTLWNPDGITLEMGISIISLCIIGMWIGIRSNRWFIFLASAIASSMIPLIYEFTLTVARSGSDFIPGEGLFLFIPILLAEGWFAASPRLRQDLVQRASIVLVGFVVIYQLISLDGRDFVVASVSIGSNSTWLSLPIILWFATLLAYLPATLDRRTPWMPIGLALTAAFIPDPSSRVVWPIALGSLTYLMYTDRARRWVADCTYIALSIAFLIADWLGFLTDTIGIDPTRQFVFAGFDIAILPAIALIAIGETAIRTGKLNENAFRVGQLAIVLSNAVIWGQPGLEQAIFAVYVIWSMIVSQNRFRALADPALNERLRLSTTMAVGSGILIVLAFTRRLGLEGILTHVGISTEFLSLIPLDMPLELIFLAVLLYLIGHRTTDQVLDLGHLVAKVSSSAKPLVEWSSEQNAWVKTQREESEEWAEEGWGMMARPTLVGTIGLLVVSLTISLEHAPTQAWILLAPINALLVFEVSKGSAMTSRSRAVAIWILVATAFLPGLIFDESVSPDDVASRIGFDIVVLSGPVAAFALMRYRGVETDSVSHGTLTVAGLVVLSLLDASGGLLSWSCLILAMWGALRIDHPNRQLEISQLKVQYVVPFAWILLAMINGLENDALIHAMLGTPFGYLAESSASWMFGAEMPRIMGAALIGCGIAMMVPHKSLLPSPDDSTLLLEQVNGLLLGPIVAIGFGLDLLLPESTGIAFLLVLLITGLSIRRGELESLHFVAPLALFSFVEIATKWLQLDGIQLYSASFGVAGLLGCYIQFAARHGIGGLNAHSEGEKVDHVQRVNRSYALAGLGFSAGIAWGFGAIVAAVWVTKLLLESEDPEVVQIRLDAVGFLPLLHCLVVANSLFQLALVSDFFTTLGTLLLLAGLACAVLGSLRPPSISQSNLEASKQEEMHQRLMLSGFAWSVIGSLIIGSSQETLVPFGMTSIALGFLNAWYGAKRDESWRRSANLIGTPIGLLCLLLSVNSMTMASLIILLGGMNFLFSFVLYGMLGGAGFQPLHEQSVLPTGGTSGTKSSGQAAVVTSNENESEAQELAKIAAAVDELEGMNEEQDPSLLGIKEKVRERLAEDEVVTEHVEKAEKKFAADPAATWDSALSSLSTPPTSGQIVDASKGAIQQQTVTTAPRIDIIPSFPESYTMSTDMGFDVVLPPSLLQKIKQVIGAMDEPGWRPVLRLEVDGSVVIDWVKSPA